MTESTMSHREDAQLELSIQKLEKKLQSQEKKNAKLESEGEEMKEAMRVMKAENHTLKAEFEQKMKERETKILELEKSHRFVKSEMERFEFNSNKADLTLQSSRETERKAVREMQSLKDELKSAQQRNDALNSQIISLQLELKESKGRIQSYQERFNSVKDYERQIRKLSNINEKLEKDLQYWEQQHYSVHHKLADLKKQVEELGLEIVES